MKEMHEFEKALDEGKFIYDDDPYQRGWNDALEAVKLLLKTAVEGRNDEDQNHGN